MKRLTKILVSIACATVMLFGSGCGSSNKMDEIFQGNYVEVSEETMRGFLKNTDSVQDWLGELIRNNGGVSVRMKSMTGFMYAVEGKGVLNADGTYRYMETVSGLVKPPALYRDGEYCYVREGKKKTAHRHLQGYYSCVSDSGITSMMNTIMVQQFFVDTEAPMTTRFYMDTTDTGYIKIKVAGKMFVFAAGNIIAVYSKDYKLIAITLYGAGMEFLSATPWTGTITPPDDLNTYIEN